MQPASYFKKKLQKKEAKVARAAEEKGLAVFQKPKKVSTLKGPIVSSSIYYTIDSKNKNYQAPQMGKKRHREMVGNAEEDENSKISHSAASLRHQQQSLSNKASSKAQKKFIRNISGDDLLSSFKSKLSGSAFRILNEQLYNSSNSYAGMLLKDKQTFEDYHKGYRTQLAQWPMDPNQILIDALLKDKRGRFLENKIRVAGQIPENWIIADMGCGDARIAKTLVPHGYQIHSFDLCVSDCNKDYITIANSISVPLGNASVDICIFSLSLMATDYMKSIIEAYRILRPKKLLKIVEVRSRIPDAAKFAELIESVGFKSEWRDLIGNYFVAFDFVRNELPAKDAGVNFPYEPSQVLLPCLYKKR